MSIAQDSAKPQVIEHDLINLSCEFLWVFLFCPKMDQLPQMVQRNKRKNWIPLHISKDFCILMTENHFLFLTGYPSVFALKDAADAAEKKANEGVRKGKEGDKRDQEVENERQIVSVKDTIEEDTEGLADKVEDVGQVVEAETSGEEEGEDGGEGEGEEGEGEEAGGDGEERHEMVKKKELEEVEAKKETQTEPSMEVPFGELTLGEDDVFEVR